jgi:cytidylate kinase
MIRPFIVTIDGPSAAGKGTISYLLARRYGFLYIDSGAIFRAITWLAIKQRVPLDTLHAKALASLACSAEIRLVPDLIDASKRMGVVVNQQDVSDQIRTEILTGQVPLISALPDVRAVVVDLQHRFAGAATHGVVIEGRDVGTVVFPEAQLKIFLTASADVRAQRRHAEYVEMGKSLSYEEVYSDLVARDQADIERTHSPLTKPHNAVVIDSTDLDVHEVVERLATLIDQQLPQE